jgi:tetratricopeptide (TPR) repeat protein
MEIGLLHHHMGRDKESNIQFLEAAKESGLDFELTGAMGKKTKFQIEAHTQLVLLAESRVRVDVSKAVGEGKGEGSGKILPTTLALNDDTLLEETEFTKSTTPNLNRLSHLDPADQPPLHPLDQALLLSMCLAQHNNTPTSGLTASQMMPFVTRVITHPLNWSVHTTALLLRSRLESTRSRTVERSTLQLQALIEQMPTSDSTTVERLKYFHQLPLPSRWEMERELGKRYVSMGVTRSALEVFTRLEMWEDVVGCLQRMEMEKEAEKVVRDLLEGKKIESDLVVTLGRTGITEKRRVNLESGRAAKLWCLLGDLALSQSSESGPQGKTTAKEHYTKAWDLSNSTSSRAMRSLGSIYFTSGEYEEAIPCFEKALKISPLYARVWFTMGVSLVRLERWREARDAFQRGVGVEVDDAEGWNNLAAVYLRLGEEGLPAGQVCECFLSPHYLYEKWTDNYRPHHLSRMRTN